MTRFQGRGQPLDAPSKKGFMATGSKPIVLYIGWRVSERGRFAQLVEATLKQASRFIQDQLPQVDTTGVFPALVYKCYHPTDLAVLDCLREFINGIEDTPLRDFFKLGLTDTLRGAAAAGTGWPYIAPRQEPPTTTKNALVVFMETVRQMVNDWWQVSQAVPTGQIANVLGDSRQPQSISDGQIKLAITSPPYLNNYDYADRTRLETYFWGITQTWADITRLFRDKLITAATTQVTRSQHHLEQALDSTIASVAPDVYATLQTTVQQLSELRLTKGGKKDYDLMTALYFNDLLQVLQETYRVLEKGGHFLLVLGDSAPYGVHIATETLIGELGLGVGFSQYDYDELRQRGTKWKNNPQRHKVPLREGVLILRK